MRVDDIRLFVQIAQAGSFSAAARSLEMTPALASSSIQRLESELGVRLFVRTTRCVRLSEDGERYLPHAKAACRALTDGRHAMQDVSREISGQIKLSMPSDVGRNVLLAWLDEFQASHPKLDLNLQVSDRPVDLVRQPLDAAIRYGVQADSALIAFAIAPNNRRALCAAPSYIKQFGAPKTPDELVKHNCLRYVWGEQVFSRWTFQLPGSVQSVAVSGDRVSDDADVVRRWAVMGRGIVYKSRLDLLSDIQAGRLVELLPSHYGERNPLNLVCADRSSLTPVIQKLKRFLKTRCAESLVASRN